MVIYNSVFQEGRNEMIDDSDDSETSDVSVSSDSDNSDDSDSDNDEDPTAFGREENEEEDELVQAIENSRNHHRGHPPAIPTEEFVVNVCFHPEDNIIALANVEGDILMYKYDNEDNTLIATIEVHERACRDVQFNAKGDTIFSVSKDKSMAVTDVTSGKLKRFYDKAHECPIYTTTIINENVVATGDDDGTIKIWDLRQRGSNPILSVKENGDYISSMITNDDGKYLVCASGDGVLTTLNVPARKLHVQSEEYDDEFTSLGLFKGNTKLLTASNTGKMYVFNWGEFGFHSDEFPNLTKKAINCIIPITDNVVITGGEDGLLRAFSLFPHRRLGIVGQHDFSIETVDISNDGTLIASSSHDNIVKFWNVKYFETLNVEEPIKGGKQKQMKHNLPSSKVNNAGDFFADLE
ncbi:WD repeat-containing protein 55 homolog [Fopius arisanus]|uniref:WD repeat-containing protein 55 homolog n=2 Tax=Fopius arisanus TaxID=64838 RepID=A0A9R1THA2_9HYME|nr:PREDICTED: WD repeat-containing protein 55 homolog [Fopius arisanus]XP_011309336.1 PREDICTED: WD repeat-containing protein 55 homolog [Fopius arisanus]